MIVFGDEALSDLERIFAFNAERDAASAPLHIAKIQSAVSLLEAHPKIGRPIARGAALRELVISYGSTGYIALYEHSTAEDLIRVVAVRHQREAGYRDS
ncbi:MAG: type II toxin-antitoxin system RelE/ParE family toxin [Burkholderiales bacterium]